MTKYKSDWSWKGGDDNFKRSKKARRKAKLKREKKQQSKDFYSSEEWRKLRYRVLRKYSGSCMCCGRNKRNHGVVLHVDHIKPRSKYPTKELDFDNMQILCEDCNLGKSNIDETDWRPNDKAE